MCIRDRNGSGCKSYFRFADLERRLALEEPRTQIECPGCLAYVSVTKLLFGISQTTERQVLDRLDEVEQTLLDSGEETRDLVKSEMDELRQLSQRQFLTIFNSQQKFPESMTPRVFTLRTAEPKDWKEALAGIWQNKWKLQLYCEAPGCWHPPGVELGLYDVNTLA